MILIIYRKVFVLLHCVSEMVDELDCHSSVSNDVRVRVPSPLHVGVLRGSLYFVVTKYPLISLNP